MWKTLVLVALLTSPLAGLATNENDPVQDELARLCAAEGELTPAVAAACDSFQVTLAQAEGADAAPSVPRCKIGLSCHPTCREDGARICRYVQSCDTNGEGEEFTMPCEAAPLFNPRQNPGQQRPFDFRGIQPQRPGVNNGRPQY